MAWASRQQSAILAAAGDTPGQMYMGIASAVGAGVRASRFNHVHNLLGYNELAATLFTVAAGAAGWVDLDISSAIGTGVRYADVWISHNNAGGQTVGVRTNGSSQVRSFLIPSANLALFARVKADANGIIEVYRDTGADAYVRVIGQHFGG